MKIKKAGQFLAAAAGVFSADYIILRLLLNLAVERNCRFYKGNSQRSKPYEKEIEQGKAWLGKQKMKEVTIHSFDGLKLKGDILEADKPERILVMFHGWRGSVMHDFGTCARAMYEEGCSLLLVDQRAQGRSEGGFMGMGVLERSDCYSWLKWVQKYNKDGLPIFLYGVSMGAATVLMAAEGDLPPEVKGVIADCGFSSPYEMVLQFGKKHFKMIGTSTIWRLNLLCRKRAGFDLKEYSAVEALEYCKVPVLFIHGKADTFIPYEMTVKNYKACRSDKELLLVDGAEHCMSFATNAEQYMEAVRRLFS